jgi:hypothetical protein
MSMTRTGHGPMDWRDEGPAPGRLASKTFSVQANTIPAMRPIVSLGGTFMTPAGTGWGKGEAFSIHPENRKPRLFCGVGIRQGVTCARAFGHANKHASRASLQADAERRRKA